MKSSEVEVGKRYAVKVSGRISKVQLLRVSPYGGWDGLNLDTNRKIRIRTAAKLRYEMKKPEVLKPAVPNEDKIVLRKDSKFVDPMSIIDFTCPYAACQAELTIYARNVIEGSVSACHKCNQRFVFRDGYLEKWPEDEQLNAQGFTCHDCGSSFMYRSLATKPNRNGTLPENMVPAYCPDCGQEISDATAFGPHEALTDYQRKLQAKCSVCGCQMGNCQHDDCSGCGGKHGRLPKPWSPYDPNSTDAVELLRIVAQRLDRWAATGVARGKYGADCDWLEIRNRIRSTAGIS